MINNKETPSQTTPVGMNRIFCRDGVSRQSRYLVPIFALNPFD